jgi:tetratricopeptide (TPR) repeat protein
VVEAPRARAVAGVTAASAVGPRAASRPAARAVASIPPVTGSQVLSEPVLNTFLQRVGARADAASPMIRDLVQSAQTKGVADLYISDVVAAEYPVAAFLKGLSLLSQQRFDPAANAFRSAMRGSPDFFPAMFYLGACYAAGGNDKEAAGAWRTALIKEGDQPAIHLLIAEAHLRQDRGDLALQALDGARSRWPADAGLKRRFVVAALLAGEYADGLQTLDELMEQRAEDEPSLAVALRVLYEAIADNRPIAGADLDRTRMDRYAEAYRARGGPSLGLVEMWITAIREKR